MAWVICSAIDSSRHTPCAVRKSPSGATDNSLPGGVSPRFQVREVGSSPLHPRLFDGGVHVIEDDTGGIVKNSSDQQVGEIALMMHVSF